VTSSVLVALRVKVSAQRAFEAFTGEIDQWWRPNALFELTPRGDGVLSFEPGENGRLITTLPNGKVFELGRITAWVPGERLAFTWRMGTFAPDQVTHVEVIFEQVGEDETRVSVEHRGWDTIPQEHVARHNFPERVFLMRQGEHWRTLLDAFAVQVTKAG
jgi:uncharacterized protein YndB with AHSA1/START domain